MFEEYKTFVNLDMWDPANYSHDTEARHKSFFHHYLHWYGKSTYNNHLVYSMAFVNAVGEIQTFWTSALPKALILKTKSTTKSMIKISLQQKRLLGDSTITWPSTQETWWRIKGRVLTPNTLSVGPYSWHSGGSQKYVRTFGDPILNFIEV